MLVAGFHSLAAPAVKSVVAYGPNGIALDTLLAAAR